MTDQIQSIKQELERMEAQIERVLPSHVPVKKFIRIALTAVQLNGKLLDCVRSTLWAACLKCAQDGLLPDGKQAALIPRNRKGVGLCAVYTPMVAGLCIMARNSGEIATIDAGVVYEKDDFDAWTDEKGAHFTHRRARGERGNPWLTYAYCLTKDGGFYFEEIDEQQMAAIEKSSTANEGPWDGPFRDEMRRKSAIRRLCKYRVPSSADLDSYQTQDGEIQPRISGEDTTPLLSEPSEGLVSEETVKTIPAKRMKAIVEAAVIETPKQEEQVV